MFESTRRLLQMSVFTLAAACGQPAAVNPEDRPLRGTDAFRDFGEYIIYVNALTTDVLTPDVALEYGIVRSSSRAMLNVSVHKNEAGAMPTTPVRARITATATNLTGQLKEVGLREIAEGDAIYYIGESDFADGETLIYAIAAVPENETEPLSFRYQRQFFIVD